jgi:hypothetical protein
MLKGTLRNLLLSLLLLLPCPTLLAETEHFWLLQEYGIEKRAMSDGTLILNFAPLTHPQAFALKPKKTGIWAIADGFLVSFDASGTVLNSTPLDNVNQNAYLVSKSKGGVWLFHGDKRYSYSDELILEENMQLPVNGQQINDVTHHRRSGVTWITAGQSAIAIDSEGDIAVHELEKNEKINAITTTREGEIALLISTPKAEFRLYTPEFEPIISHPLDEVTPSPDNIAVTKDGSFWITGKQHILLLDSDEGILINQQHNGDIPQGPGESQLVVNNFPLALEWDE